MKAKYYLRGMGLGIIVTSLIFMIANLFYKPSLSADEIILEARRLGMVTAEEAGEKKAGEDPKKEDDSGADSTTGAAATSEKPDDGKVNAATGENAKAVTGGNTDAATEGNAAARTGSSSSTENDARTGSGATVTRSYRSGDQVSGDLVNIAIVSGETAGILARDLADHDLVDSAETFQNYLGQHGYAQYLQPGTYEIKKGSSFEEIAKIVTQNKVNGD